jgi:gliding motility-associated-like protein
MTLYITSDQATTYSVEVYGGSMIQSGSIAAGQVVTAIVPATYFINNEGTFTKKAVHITSARAVVVYAYITRSQASGATLCLPVQDLGKEYYSMNFTQVSNEPNSNSYITIVAVDDNTAVEITPSAATKGGKPANVPFTVSLNKGDIYQVLGALNAANPNNGVDLTGTHIRSIASGTGSCKRIAVFSGSGKVRIPQMCNASSSDNLFQQLYPTGSWGLKYLTAPSYNNPNNYYRIAKSNPAANVYVNGVLVPPAQFINGIWYEFFNSTPNLIQSDLPISVAQYFTTQGCDHNGAPYDPDMIMLNPVEQNIDNVTLVSSNLATPGTQLHHLQIIIPNKGTALSSFRLDGKPVNGWVTHPSDANYSYIYLPNVGQGYHTLSSDTGFNALAYGFASAESYGYSAGANVKDLYQFVSTQNQYATVNYPATCKNSPFYFSMTFPYQPTKIVWNFFGLFPDTTLLNPVYDSTWMVNGRQLYRYKLPSSYSVSTPGIYPIQLLAQNPTTDGCSGEQQINYDLQVYAAPTADFSFSSNGCFTDPVNFLGSFNADGTSVISQSWNFGDGNSASDQNTAHQYSSADSYTVKYSVITDVGCISDTVKKIVAISEPPVAKFNVSAPICEDNMLTFTDQSSAASGPPITKWTWNFGDGTSQVIAANGNPQPHMYVSYGTNTASLQVETSSGCKSVLYSKQIAVSPNPFASFNFSGACLPSGTTQFTDQSSIATGNITQWLWNFGDGNTSTDQSPIHNYTSSGPFNVTLTVTSASGCTDDSVRVMNKVYAQPVASFSAPAEVCYGTTINFTDQSTAPNSTVAQWLWNFGDGTTSTQQSPSKIYAAPNTYSVTLTIVSAANCSSATMTKTVVVDPLPDANFTISSPNCTNQNIAFTDASVANSGNIVKWTWDFGDGNISVMNANTFITHSYSSENKYNATLKVETDKGCSSTLFPKEIEISPVPVVDFVLPESCLNDPYSSFTDNSSIEDGTQNLFTHKWDFGDPNASGANPNTSSAKDPQHRYTATGSYNVTETIISNKGCTSSISKSFFINGSVPVPSFALQENTSVCSGDTIHLTDNSSVKPGNVIKLEIYWDYMNDPTIKTTDDEPLSGKIYTHSYPGFTSPVSKTVTMRYVAYSGQTCVQYIDKRITLKALPQLQFDPIQSICQDVPAFQITQQSVLNGLNGTGIFTGAAVSSSGIFNPSAASTGINTIRYTYTANNGCISSIDQTIEVYPVPVADAGPDKFVLEGGEVTLTPAVRTNYPVTYTWTPSTWLDSAEIETPKSKPLDDITYTLTVVSDKGCKSSDEVFVKVLKTPLIPNIFSPNRDGIHDKWDIPYLQSYPGCTVDIYNRYGQLIYHSVGYDKLWDGTVNGNPVPVGTYYYIIDPKNGRRKMSGYVDVIR